MSKREKEDLCLNIFLAQSGKDWMEMARSFERLNIHYDCYSVRVDPITVIIHNHDENTIREIGDAGWVVSETENPAIEQIRKIKAQAA